MKSLSRHILLVGVVGLFCAAPVMAQMENVETVDGSGDRTLTLTAEPHRLADMLSVRAMGITGPATQTRWALSFIGAAPEDSISIQYGDKSLAIERINRPEDGIGPTRVYVSEEAFLTMAETSEVTLTVGDVSTALPEQMRREMQFIFKELS